MGERGGGKHCAHALAPAEESEVMSLSSLHQLRFGTRDEAICFLFSEGYPYELIRCFLATMFGVCISLSTLKRSLRRLNMRRRGVRYRIWQVARCLLVSLESVYTLVGNVKCVSATYGTLEHYYPRPKLYTIMFLPCVCVGRMSWHIRVHCWAIALCKPV